MEKKPFHAEKLSDSAREKVNAVVKKFRDAGLVFAFRETSDEYVIEHGDKEYHFGKLEKFLLKEKGEIKPLSPAEIIGKEMERMMREEKGL